MAPQNMKPSFSWVSINPFQNHKHGQAQAEQLAFCSSLYTLWELMAALPLSPMHNPFSIGLLPCAPYGLSFLVFHCNFAIILWLGIILPGLQMKKKKEPLRYNLLRVTQLENQIFKPESVICISQDPSASPTPPTSIPGNPQLTISVWRASLLLSILSWKPHWHFLLIFSPQSA